MDLNTLNKLWDAAEAEGKENENRVINYVEAVNAVVNDADIKVKPNLESRRDRTVYIEFVKPDGKEAFGADVNFRVNQPYSFKTGEYGEVEFSMGCSTMGRVSRAEAPYQVCRCYLMAELWKREQEIIKLFETLSYDAYQAARKAQQEYDSELREIERAAEDKLSAEIKAELKIGYKFSDTYTNNYAGKHDVTVDYTIEKETPKRYYLRYIYNETGTRYYYDPELKKRTKLNKGIEHATYTGYIDKSRLETILLRQRQGEQDWYVLTSVEGSNRVDFNFEVLETEDLPEEDQW